jgi:hypothetical protein
MMIKDNQRIYVTEAQFKVIKNLEGECKKHMTGFDKQLWLHGIRNILGSPVADYMKERHTPIKFEQVKDRCPL